MRDSHSCPHRRSTWSFKRNLKKYILISGLHARPIEVFGSRILKSISQALPESLLCGPQREPCSRQNFDLSYLSSGKFPVNLAFLDLHFLTCEVEVLRLMKFILFFGFLSMYNFQMFICCSLGLSDNVQDAGKWR